MHSEWQGRLNHWRDALMRDLYLPLGDIALEGFTTMAHLTPDEAMRGAFAPMAAGTRWGRSYEYCWLRGEITLPPEAQGQRIAMDLRTGGEATLFVDGAPFGTYRAGWVATPHHFMVDNTLARGARAGETHTLLVEAYAGHFYPESPRGGCATGPVRPGDYGDPKAEGSRATLEGCTYGIWNEDAYQLYLDVTTLEQAMDQAEPESLRADKLAAALEQYTLTVDFEQPLERRTQSYRAAREGLRAVLAARGGDTVPTYYAIGNAHLDLAWLWPVAETARKTARTFAAQLRLMDEYPAYRFLQSQPAAYELCRQHYPALFEDVRKAIADGRWIAEGAMWVEPDTNMTGGESLVRQLIHGKRYFREMFGIDSVMLWLPDTFGYSAALPQLLRGCGVRYLVTQKIFWSYNEGDAFPYHYFAWQGLDGSAIDTFLPTSYTYRTDPAELCETWRKRAQKRGLDAFLLPFGYGDGGGGPCRDHVEYAQRAADLEGVPRVRMAEPNRFFEDMERAGGPQNTWVGEMYFSAHRGVFTSQAAIKKGNRKCEVALREAELWGALAMARGVAYPLARMDAAWKTLLFNQFHDILPGSSIARVYEEARADHRQVQAEAEAVAADAQRALLTGEGVTVLNALSFMRQGVVALPDAFAHGARTAAGAPVPVSGAAGGVLALVDVPACGGVTLHPAANPAPLPPCTATLTTEGAVLENALVRVAVNRLGEVTSYVDRRTGREFAGGPMNSLRLYKDVPRLFDAWDIDSNYALQPVPVDGEATLSLLAPEGLRAAVHVSRAVGSSRFSQRIVLAAGSARVDFETEVDWDELHRLLKVRFPVAVQASEAINEIQYGYIRRPTHRSRLYDSDRFEVCQQRYTALADQGHGAAVLNDCKYGVSQLGNAVELTLLRASASPEMRADRGIHTFTYSFLGWEGPFAHSPVVREAYALNVPLRVAEGGGAPASAFSLDAANVFIDAVKPAEDGSGDIVLRLYEAMQSDTRCTLFIGLPVAAVWVCDMLENSAEALPLDGGHVALHLRAFEVKTLRLRVAG
jgi:alpha-mannosidase